MADTAKTSTLTAGGFIVSEAPGFLSREQAVIALSQTIIPGSVLARRAVIALTTATAVADAANTGGSGVLTVDPTTPVLAGAKNGAYRVVCIEPGANVGTFAVFDPLGAEIGRYNVAGAAFAIEIKFTISDATDFVAGDGFSVIVGIEKADYEWGVLNTAATDGLEVAAGIAINGVVTGGSVKGRGAVFRRNGEVRGVDLTWPAGITAANKAAGIARLEALGIAVR